MRMMDDDDSQHWKVVKFATSTQSLKINGRIGVKFSFHLNNGTIEQYIGATQPGTVVKVFFEKYFANHLMSNTQFILKAGRAYELTNCFTTFSELSLLRGERQELERSGREDNEKSLGENSVDILLTGELHSEGRGHLPSAYQPSVLTRVRMIMPLALKSGVWRR